MSYDYSKLVATAARLIERFGQGATLIQRVKTGPAHNPTITETELPIKAAVFNYSLKEREGSLIGQTDKKLYISTDGLANAPATADKVTVGGKTFSIIDVSPLSPAGTDLFYEAQVRI